MIREIFAKIRQTFSRWISAKLSAQLVLSFLAMFTFVMIIAFISLYSSVTAILKTNSENNTIQMFGQCDFNLERFCGDIDLLSRQLIVDADLFKMNQYADSPKSEQVVMANVALSEFTDIINNYKYVDSILYYGGEELVIYSSVSSNLVIYGENAKYNQIILDHLANDSQKNRQSVAWFGGYASDDFTPDHATKLNQVKTPYITAARRILLGSYTGTLLVNIKESYFTSVYDHSLGSSVRSMYITDQGGTVISSQDTERLGQKPEYLQTVSNSSDMGDDIISKNGEQLLLVYYQLDNFPGILISETPLQEIYQEIYYIRNVLLVLFLLSFVMALILSRFWIAKLLKPLSQLTAFVKKIGHGNLGVTMQPKVKNELGILVGQFNQMSLSIRDLFSQNERVQTEKRNLEMETLRSQINPHFIYNTLNTIKWMAVISKANNIAESITTLSDFLEPIFKSRDPFCTLREEISYIQNYVKIMNYRFAGGFTLHVDMPDDLAQVFVIRFILQPVVENALVHGLIGKAAGNVRIAAQAEAEDLMIYVRDDGDGMEQSRLQQVRHHILHGTTDKQSSIGLSNVHRRLKIQYGDSYGLSLNSVLGQGSEVVLRMPIVRKLEDITIFCDKTNE